MENKNKINLKASLLALIMSFNLALEEIPTSYAASFTDEVIVVEYQNNDGKDITINCKEYTVVKNDNPSKISRKMCKEYGVEVTSKYWPVFCYLNGYPRTIHPGEKTIYPETFAETLELYNYLRESNWLSRYIQKNNVYSKKAPSFMTDYTIAMILDDEYGRGTSKNKNFVHAYLDAVDMENYEDQLNKKLNNNEVHKLTKWLPTRDELKDYGYVYKPKRR